MPWPINRRNSFPCTVGTSQRKVVQSKGWVSKGCYLTQYPWALEYRIPLHADYAMDSLDDHLNRRRIPPLRGNGNNQVVTLCRSGGTTLDRLN